MKNEEAVKLILEYYNNLKSEIFIETEYGKGHLCAIRHILMEVYDFKDNDKRL